MRLHVLFLLAIVMVSTSFARSNESLHEPWEAKCVQTAGVHDGDTLTCISDSHGSFVIRFAGIDAPEIGQAQWRCARDKLREIAVPGTIAQCYKQDQYAREVCRLKSSTGADLAETMLQAGLAWHAVRFASEQTPAERKKFADAERLARDQRSGIWAEPDPMPPWVCREARRSHQRCG